ncbi:MAG: hypothetical protein H8F28_01815 [Fibrella sp.]|nr:hypothetical protein [Armatimonadota bacterium]
MPTGFNFDWNRFWCPRKGRISLDSDGYLIDPETDRGKIVNTDLVTLSTLTQVPCLVLLGEPGAGKSKTMARERQALATSIQGSSDVVLHVDLRSADSRQSLKDMILEKDEFRTWKLGSHRLHLFLDSLDECLLKAESAATFLTDELPGESADRLSVRIACRTAVWSRLAVLEDWLHEVWGKHRADGADGFGVYELAPLRRRDVVLAADFLGVPDPQEFLQTVRLRKATAFAARPITLQMLIGIYKDSGSLPSSQSDLYRQGCRRLCKELNPSRIASRATGRLSEDERMAVAGRLAAVTIFANRDAIYMGPDDERTSLTSVPVVALVGGHERVADLEFEVDREAVAEVLEDTGLFTSRGSNLMGWAHQTYAEFLAAWYVTEAHHPPSRQLVGLLSHQDDPDRKIAPQLHQVATWIAPSSPETLNHVLRTDPEVLLAGDAGALGEADRAKIVERLLELVQSEKLPYRELFTRGDLRSLDHSGLAQQLRNYLRDGSRRLEARCAALDIAEDCGCAALQNEFLQLALNPGDAHQVRRRATRLLVRLGDSQTKATLLPLAQGVAGDDPDDELKGEALTALWPDHISANELFALLTPPKQYQLHGSYRHFLTNTLAGRLRNADLPVALAWAGEHQHRHPNHLDSVSELATACVHQAWDHLHDPAVLSAFVSTAFVRLRIHEPLFASDIYDRVEIPVALGDAGVRHLVIDALLVHGIENGAGPTVLPVSRRVSMMVAIHHPKLVTAEDLPWLIQRLRETPGNSDLHQERSPDPYELSLARGVPSTHASDLPCNTGVRITGSRI